MVISIEAKMSAKRQCSTCKKTKLESSFPWDKTRGRHRYYCRECYNSYQRQWYAKNQKVHLVRVRKAKDKARERIRRLIDTKKTACIVCGEPRRACLDFHHVNREEKMFTIARATAGGFSVERVEEEIRKCVVTCSNCHRLVEAGEISIPAVAQG